MTDETEPPGPSRAQRIIAWPFILLATAGILGAAGLVIADVILRLGANAPIGGVQEIAGLILAGVFVLGLPAAAILGARSGGPSHPRAIRRWWSALHTTFLFLIEAVVLAAFALLLLGNAFRRMEVGEKSMDLQLSMGLIQIALGLGVLIAAVLVLIAGAMRLVRGR